MAANADLGARTWQAVKAEAMDRGLLTEERLVAAKQELAEWLTAEATDR